jgi:hypothetical protein
MKAVAILCLLLVGCASTPQPKATVTQEDIRAKVAEVEARQRAEGSSVRLVMAMEAPKVEEKTICMLDSGGRTVCDMSPSKPSVTEMPEPATTEAPTAEAIDPGYIDKEEVAKKTIAILKILVAKKKQEQDAATEVEQTFASQQQPAHEPTKERPADYSIWYYMDDKGELNLQPWLKQLVEIIGLLSAMTLGWVTLFKKKN